MNKSHLVWYQKDLRVEDNTSLYKACQGDRVIAVYCFDPLQYQEDVFGFKKTGKYRARFLLETIIELRENLDRLNVDLIVSLESPETFLPKIIEEYGITKVFLQKEWTKEEVERLEKVKKNCSISIVFEESFDQFLFHPNDIPFTDFKKIPEVFTDFRKDCEKLVSVRKPLLKTKSQLPENRILISTKIPSLIDLGFENWEMDTRTAFPFKGGENQGLERMNYYFWETKKLSNYKSTRNGLTGIDYSSKLSPWLANGSISAKMIYWQLQEYEKLIQKNQDTYWLLFELIWRDYFKYISLKHGNAIFKLSGVFNKKIKFETQQKVKSQWINGTTKEPFINANMIELAKTGWMSNRGRQNVASYWSKELGQDWRIGAAYFESLLLDYDVHSNWCNWMYNSGVGNDPRDRQFNIKRQTEMYDPNGTYQKIWLP